MLVTDVSVQSIDPIFKGEAIQVEWPLNLLHAVYIGNDVDGVVRMSVHR